MSFSTITAASLTPTALTVAVGVQTRPTITASRTYAYSGNSVNPVALGAFVSAAVNTEYVDKPMAGWITYSDPGCPTCPPVDVRPTTGMLYPRF